MLHVARSSSCTSFLCSVSSSTKAPQRRRLPGKRPRRAGVDRTRRLLGSKRRVLRLPAARAEQRYEHADTRPHARRLSSTSVLPSGLSSSLAPPPLDHNLTVAERLRRAKTCLTAPAAAHGASVVVAYDIIEVYKSLVLSCGVSLGGSSEDPKVSVSEQNMNVVARSPR